LTTALIEYPPALIAISGWISAQRDLEGARCARCWSALFVIFAAWIAALWMSIWPLANLSGVLRLLVLWAFQRQWL